MADIRILTDAQEFGEYGVRVLRPCVSSDGDGAACGGVSFEAARVDPAGCRVLAFHSLWGREFTPQWRTLDGRTGLVFEVDSGRSSHGYSPALWLLQRDGSCAVVAVCFSGNWRVEIAPSGVILCSFTQEMLSLRLESGEEFALPAVIVGSHAGGIDGMSERLTAFLERHWLRPSRIRQAIVEWNHWWPYEDGGIDEEVFRRNADAACELGFNLCTLDAGWFGGAESAAPWYGCRGDWDMVNKKRFPGGLKSLSDYVHGKGMKFGIWMEPEGMGRFSRLRREHPEWEALRDGEPLPEPYLCLGAAGAEEWLFGTLERTVRESACDWIKLDFNVDPGFGCNRADHGHRQGAGLHGHVSAYYRVLDRLREEFPSLIVENCSSGGLRFDLEMLRHVDVFFLSDPDETAHSLQCFYGASLAFPPGRLLHWSWSQTRAGEDGGRPFPSFEIGPDTPDAAIRCALRAAMPHLFGVSRDLAALPARAKEIFREEIALYKDTVFPLVMGARLHRLTGQPLRLQRTDDLRMLEANPEWAGKGIAAFEFEKKGEGIVLVFQLDDSSSPVLLRGLCKDKAYRLVDVDRRAAWVSAGEELMSRGIAPALKAGESAVITFAEA